MKSAPHVIGDLGRQQHATYNHDVAANIVTPCLTDIVLPPRDEAIAEREALLDELEHQDSASKNARVSEVSTQGRNQQVVNRTNATRRKRLTAAVHVEKALSELYC